MTRFRILVALAFSILVSSPMHAAENYGKAMDIFKGSPVVQPYFETAFGYALFPEIGKGAVGIGGAYGKGQTYRGGKLSGNTEMTQLTVGLTLGGQTYSEVIFFQDRQAYEKFTSGNFEFSAQASAIAITAGAIAQGTSTGSTASATAGGTAGKQKASYESGMAVFTHAKGGLMFEASLGGQKFKFKPL